MSKTKDGKSQANNKTFKLLDDDWKDNFSKVAVDDINTEIATVAKNQAELDKAQEEDADLAALQEQVKEASAVYRDGKKINKSKIRFLVQVLDDRGAE